MRVATMAKHLWDPMRKSQCVSTIGRVGVGDDGDARARRAAAAAHMHGPAGTPSVAAGRWLPPGPRCRSPRARCAHSSRPQPPTSTLGAWCLPSFCTGFLLFCGDPESPTHPGRPQKKVTPPQNFFCGRAGWVGDQTMASTSCHMRQPGLVSFFFFRSKPRTAAGPARLDSDQGRRATRHVDVSRRSHLNT